LNFQEEDDQGLWHDQAGVDGAGDIVMLGVSNHNNIIHAYLRDTRIPGYPGYKECRSCGNRTQSTCMKCGYCYNCHNVLLTEQFSPPLQQQRKVLDVYGQNAEPICSYRTCRHKFSLHNTRRCRCRHALNYATGVSI
jgi:hypothetical protein